MAEQRRSERLSSWLHATYATGNGNKTFTTVTRNVGDGGVSLLTDRQFNQGTQLKIEVQFHNHKPVTFTGEVRWSQPLLLSGTTSGPRAFESGIRFIDINPEDKKQILLYTVLSPSPSPTT